MSIGKRISYYRRLNKMTQQDLANQLDVTCNAVSNWERDEHVPDLDRLNQMSELFKVPIDKIIHKSSLPPDVKKRKKLFDETHMYTYIKTYAQTNNMTQTYAAISFARKKHDGQFRKCTETKIPYIYHPLMMACHAIAMGINNDSIIAAILLHDVVEDCGVRLEELPVDEKAKQIVSYMSYDKTKMTKDEYYDRIASDPDTCLVKCIDRCNNTVTIAADFPKASIVRYLLETEQYIVPLLDVIKNTSPQYSHQVWLLKYHMYSILETLKRLV